MLEAQGETEMTFLLTDSAQTLERYPFPFELRAHYALTADGFVMETRVRNTGAETMWFSLGAHPGFRCEMGDQIVMDAEETVSAFRLGENGLREPEQVPVFDHSRQLVLAPDTFARDALIFDGLKSRGAALVRRNGRNVHVDFGGAPCLGLWASPARNTSASSRGTASTTAGTRTAASSTRSGFSRWNPARSSRSR